MTKLADDLLSWYDKNARELPWRISPSARAEGMRPDPYHVWLSEIMLQQTTVIVVRGYFEKFTSAWPRVEDLAQASDEDVMSAWAGLGYYARARNLLKCARQITAAGGQLPQHESDLLRLPGIGPYTAAAISAIAFDRPANVVDGNVERVISRIEAITEELPQGRSRIRKAAGQYAPEFRPGDYAQALMDLGSSICTPRSPKCVACPVSHYCKAERQGIQGTLPRKAPKRKKPTRRGIAWVARTDDGAWLLETRPESGLLGGTRGWPGTEWTEKEPEGDPPGKADWIEAGLVRHTFTHFHLELEVRTGLIDTAETLDEGLSLVRDLDPDHLPSVMKKAFERAQGVI